MVTGNVHVECSLINQWHNIMEMPEYDSSMFLSACCRELWNVRYNTAYETVAHWNIFKGQKMEWLLTIKPQTFIRTGDTKDGIAVGHILYMIFKKINLLQSFMNINNLRFVFNNLFMSNVCRSKSKIFLLLKATRLVVGPNPPQNRWETPQVKGAGPWNWPHASI